MKKNTLEKGVIIGVITILIFVALGPGIYSKDTKTDQDFNSDRNSFLHVKHADTSGIDLQFSLKDELKIKEIAKQGTRYQRLSIPGAGYTKDQGKPELPVITSYIAVPQDAQVLLDYTLSNNNKILQNINIYPCQPLETTLGETDDATFKKDVNFNSSYETYPRSIVEASPIKIMRGCRIIMLAIYPLMYQPAKKTLTIYYDIDITIKFTGETEEFIPERLRSPYFQPLFDAFLLNSHCIERENTNDQYIQQRNTRLDGERADLLIITYDAFYNDILPLAEWRHKTGIETKVVKWSEIGTTAEDLRDYMSTAYYTWELPPSFLLIVGDADHIPVNYLYEHPLQNIPTGTDHWYATFDGDDYLPDIHAGRISVENTLELQAVVTKTLQYCKTPYMQENWFDNILLAGNYESGMHFLWTLESINDYVSSHGYTCNRQYENAIPVGSTQGIIDAINSGVIIANHYDHGIKTGWIHPPFNTNHVIEDLTNGEKYPVMFSINCQSGWFDGETDEPDGNVESMAEVALRVAGKGFIGVIAASRMAFLSYSDELCRGLYDALFADFDPEYPTNESANPYETEVYKLGQVMNYGKLWMYDKYIVPGGCYPYFLEPDDESSRTQFEIFHVHGDPSLDIWTSYPQSLTVNHLQVIPFKPWSLQVTVTDSYGKPVEGAIACASQENGIYSKGITDDSGVVILNISPDTPEDITLVVTAHNYLYYEGTIELCTQNHNIGIGNIQASLVGNINDMMMVNSTIYNIGLNNESNIEVHLLIDDSIANTTNITMLVADGAEDIHLGWRQNSTDIYTVTVSVEPVPGETVLYDNNRSIEAAITTPPFQPGNPIPENGAIDVEVNSVFSWSSGDPDEGDLVRYHLYLGTDQEPPFWGVTDWFLSNETPCELNFSHLINYNTTYYWRIVAEDCHGAFTEGPLWNFTTIYLPSIVYVDDDFNASTPGWGYDHFNTIQQGVNNVSEQGTVSVQPGSYDPCTITKSLQLIGEDANTTIINGQGASSNGIFLEYITGATISGFTITKCYDAIKIETSHEITISQNYIINNLWNALFVSRSAHCSLNQNIIENSSSGIRLVWSSDNTISQNRITQCNHGINCILQSNRNTLVQNSISDSNEYGIIFEYYSPYKPVNNSIYYNNLFNNTKNSCDEGTNIWFHETLQQGNYWDDYTGNDTNGDGIGDTPYTILGGQNQDLYPLMSSYPLGDINNDGKVNTEDLLLLLGAWGTDDNQADINQDDIVDARDLLILLAFWTV